MIMMTMMNLNYKHLSSLITRSLKKYGQSSSSSSSLSSSTILLNKWLNGNNYGRIIWIPICDLSTSTSSTSSNDPKNNNNNKSQLTTETNKHQLSKDVKVGERIKQTTKDVTNLTVILFGASLFGVIIYAVFKEFISSKSPSSVFASALKKCRNDPRVTELLGQPIKGHGEMTSRGRARHVSFVEYENNGKIYIRVKFYLKGPFNTATVQCETAKDSPRSHFRYLFVEADTYPRQVIIIEDNRLIDDEKSTPSSNIFKIE